MVDDAIVVLENITRYREQGMGAMHAAFKGAAEIGFTVLSMSTSLIAVFIPILLMGGIVGRLFREFAITLSITIVVSLAVSLTTTPMMCSRLLQEKKGHGKIYRASEKVFEWILKAYQVSLAWVLRNSAVTLLILIGTICLSVFLFIKIPKGFFPEQDVGRMSGNIVGEQDTSYQAMRKRLLRLMNIVGKDPGSG